MKLEHVFNYIGLTDAMLKEATMRLYGLVEAPKSYFDQLKPKQIKRFLGNIDKGPDGRGYGKDGCWHWLREHDEDGYAIFRFTAKGTRLGRRASAMSLWYFTGQNYGILQVHHSCDNPKCVNPDHLSLGTAKANAKDAYIRGRSHFSKHRYPDRARGEEHGSAKYSEADVQRVWTSGANLAGLPYREIAKETGLPLSFIRHVKSGRTWKHLWPGTKQ